MGGFETPTITRVNAYDADNAEDAIPTAIRSAPTMLPPVSATSWRDPVLAAAIAILAGARVSVSTAWHELERVARHERVSEMLPAVVAVLCIGTAIALGALGAACAR